MVTTKNAAAPVAAKPTQTTATETKVSTAKPPMIVPEKKEQQPEVKKPVPTIEARLQKIEDLQKLVDRRETLMDAIENLGGFYIAPAGNCNLKLQDSTGKSFAIAHPLVIGEMVDMAKTRLNAELLKIENQINFDF